MRRGLVRTAVLCGALALYLVPAAMLATSVVHFNFDQIEQHADRIFIGHLAAVEPGTTAGGLPFTAYTFEVTEVLRGEVGSTITIRQVGVAEPRTVDGMLQVFKVPGMPQYKTGGEVMLFLNPDSELGLTTPVGLFQGAFSLGVDAEGDPAATNGSDNVNLLQGVANVPAVARGHRRGPIKLSVLRQLLAR